jgi:hypothetical protein
MAMSIYKHQAGAASLEIYIINRRITGPVHYGDTIEQRYWLLRDALADVVCKHGLAYRDSILYALNDALRRTALVLQNKKKGL